MRLVIDIPEEIYKASQIIDVKYEDVIQIPLEVIKNGTPLTKGHGRLIDENDLSLMTVHLIDGVLVCDAPTIIEADTESEDKE